MTSNTDLHPSSGEELLAVILSLKKQEGVDRGSARIAIESKIKQMQRSHRLPTKTEELCRKILNEIRTENFRIANCRNIPFPQEVKIKLCGNVADARLTLIQRAVHHILSLELFAQYGASIALDHAATSRVDAASRHMAQAVATEYTDRPEPESQKVDTPLPSVAAGAAAQSIEQNKKIDPKQMERVHIAANTVQKVLRLKPTMTYSLDDADIVRLARRLTARKVAAGYHRILNFLQSPGVLQLQKAKKEGDFLALGLGMQMTDQISHHTIQHVRECYTFARKMKAFLERIQLPHQRRRVKPHTVVGMHAAKVTTTKYEAAATTEEDTTSPQLLSTIVNPFGAFPRTIRTHPRLRFWFNLTSLEEMKQIKCYAGKKKDQLANSAKRHIFPRLLDILSHPELCNRFVQDPQTESPYVLAMAQKGHDEIKIVKIEFGIRTERDGSKICIHMFATPQDDLRPETFFAGSHDDYVAGDDSSDSAAGDGFVPAHPVTITANDQQGTLTFSYTHPLAYDEVTLLPFNIVKEQGEDAFTGGPKGE